MRSSLVVVVCCCLPWFAWAADDPEAKKVAETYLNSLSGKGAESGRDLLLGGVTMNAQLFNLENWEFKAKELASQEELDLPHALEMVKELDKAGRSSLSKLLGTRLSGQGVQVHELSADEAKTLLEPTREKAQALLKAHPLLAYVLRVDREVYWHPKNPMRAVLEKARGGGIYSLEVHRWLVLSKEGPQKLPREWPLRVLRFKTEKFDTGWKVLPASDWNAE